PVGRQDDRFELVHSLAQWQRLDLKEYGFTRGEGLYTNMNAIRKEEELDNLHSIYVDQWDWEKVISEEERTAEYLENTVRKIFRVIKHMQHETEYRFSKSAFLLPDEIHFVDSNDLYHAYPDLSPKERENRICRELGCVFLSRIGDKLDNGEPHDGRAPDYDDWQLNGDILFWYEPLNCALEISSMGIRVNSKSLHEQLIKADCLERESLPYHQALLKGELPLSIGGGIGQSRLCMLLLGKAHIGEVQASIWPKEMREQCREHKIYLL
ncbi:MAG: aspartate--ammonia ligase, partial [Erysipelotrichaceae bacterium]|nr:aspartate--ammonia ligase [Erysipelotrichaceae bacterium]